MLRECQGLYGSTWQSIVRLIDILSFWRPRGTGWNPNIYEGLTCGGTLAEKNLNEDEINQLAS
jgi:hypothetical protein